jgi:hypothetical protein
VASLALGSALMKTGGADYLAQVFLYLTNGLAPEWCTSSKHMAPLEPFSKGHFSARTFSSLAC